jgi:hypothetical protein
VFWLLLGICTMRFWSGLPLILLDQVRTGITRLFANNLFLPEWVLYYIPLRPQRLVGTLLFQGLFMALFNFVPLICTVILLARGRLDRAVSALRPLYRTRGRFLATSAIALLIFYSWAFLELVHHERASATGPGLLPMAFLEMRAMVGATISATLVGLTAWLMPGQRRDIEPG